MLELTFSKDKRMKKIISDLVSAFNNLSCLSWPTILEKITFAVKQSRYHHVK